MTDKHIVGPIYGPDRDFDIEFDCVGVLEYVPAGDFYFTVLQSLVGVFEERGLHTEARAALLLAESVKENFG